MSVVVDVVVWILTFIGITAAGLLVSISLVVLAEFLSEWTSNSKWIDKWFENKE